MNNELINISKGEIMNNLLKGIVLGILIGGAVPAYSYMTMDNACDLTAGDLKEIVRDAVDGCDITYTKRISC